MEKIDWRLSHYVPDHQEESLNQMQIDSINPIDKTEMVVLAENEYERLFTLLDSLSDLEWGSQTVCSEWTVKLMVAHLLGAGESNASFLEFIKQAVRGFRKARARNSDLIDGLNEVQVQDRQHMQPKELSEKLRSVSVKAIRGRQRTPRLFRGLKFGDGAGGKVSLGHLVDVVFTRDLWMHRNDISEAIGRPIALSAEHDGRIIADVVRDWASRHDSPFALELTGPAGGLFQRGTGGEEITIDAVEFCKSLGGRSENKIPLAVSVPF
jgi:uncharacterized protein (TIGR03083 family)